MLVFFIRISFFLIVLMVAGFSQSYAVTMVTIGPHDAKIDGSIPYSVIGKYRASFRAFKGTIGVDEDSGQIQSVFLKIKVASIASNCPWCDRLVRSRRLLNPSKYPNIIFQSDKIIHDASGYKVKGILVMHGVKKVMTVPFHVEKMNHLLLIQGAWSINRKDFNIIWSRYLDHGGVIVGDNFNVDWSIKRRI